MANLTVKVIDHLIPTDHRVLITSLRCAINPRPDYLELSNPDLRTVFRQAYAQGVDTYLYPWLTSQTLATNYHENDVENPLSAWREAFLKNLIKTDTVRRRLQPMLARLAQVRLDIIVLKGAWLGTTVYDDPAQRSMSDIDLLVREEDLDAVHRELTEAGFATHNDVRHNRFVYEQHYRHPDLPMPLEMHWHVTSDLTPSAPVPDIIAVWQNSTDATWHGVPVKALPPADQLAHLTQHILHHLFASPIRGYLDIALLLKKYGNELAAEAVIEAATRWHTGKAIPFLLNMTAGLFDIRLPPQLEKYCADMRPSDAEIAVTALFNLPKARDRAGESTRLAFREASAINKFRLAARRVFMPRQFMLLYYPWARHRIFLPLAWLKRAIDLCRRNRALIMRAPGTAVQEPRQQEIARLRQKLATSLIS